MSMGSVGGSTRVEAIALFGEPEACVPRDEGGGEGSWPVCSWATGISMEFLLLDEDLYLKHMEFFDQEIIIETPWDGSAAEGAITLDANVSVVDVRVPAGLGLGVSQGCFEGPLGEGRTRDDGGTWWETGYGEADIQEVGAWFDDGAATRMVLDWSDYQ